MKVLSTTAIIVLFGFLAACPEQAADDEKQPDLTKGEEETNTDSKNDLAVVAGIPVTKGEFLRYIEPYPARMKESMQGRKHVLDSLIDHILLKAEAARLGLDEDDEYLRKVENYKRNLLNNMLLEKISEGKFEVTEQEVKEYFEAHPEEFDRPERVRVRHIQLGSKAKAQEVLERIRSGESFEKLARELSEDHPTRSRGGDLGPFSREQRPELAKAAFALKKPGAVSGPVETKRGFHLLQLIRRIKAVKETFEQAHDGLRSRLRARKRQEVKNELLAKLREKTRIETNEKELESLEIPAQSE